MQLRTCLLLMYNSYQCIYGKDEINIALVTQLSTNCGGVCHFTHTYTGFVSVCGFTDIVELLHM